MDFIIKNREKVILPIWFCVNERHIRSFSPTLADHIAVRWEDGINIVLMKLIEVIKPAGIESWQKRIVTLSPLTTAKKSLIS